MSESRPFGDGLCAAVRHYLHQNNKTHLGQINAEILADIAERYFLHHEAQTKAKKKRGDATQDELAVYNAYPRKVGRHDALPAIAKAIAEAGFDAVHAATQRYASCVNRWPRAFRYHEGRDLCPHPATWFNRGSYLESEKEWMPAGMFTRDDDPRTIQGGPVAQQPLAEPEGWKEEAANHETLCIFTGRDWNVIDDYYKKQIIRLTQPSTRK